MHSMKGRSRKARLQILRELLSAGSVDSQGKLVDLLKKKGFAATQSSISRDLRELGAVKSRMGYGLPGAVGGRPIEREEKILRSLVMGAEPAGPHLLVIRTATGGASRVGLAVDRSSWPGVVGTVAGDDTLFVALESKKHLNRVKNELAAILGTA